MKFGKSLRNEIAETLPEWEGEFISYKELKKQLKLIVPWHEQSRRSRKRPRLALATENCFGAEARNGNTITGETGFRELLDSELEKVNAFFFDKEEDYVIRMRELKDSVENLELHGEATQEVKMDLLEFHKEMVLLLHYSVLNFTGLMKIVKKHNKKTGIVISLLFMPSVQQQPFFTTDLIYELLKDCEALLNQLFLG